MTEIQLVVVEYQHKVQGGETDQGDLYYPETHWRVSHLYRPLCGRGTYGSGRRLPEGTRVQCVACRRIKGERFSAERKE